MAPEAKSKAKSKQRETTGEDGRPRKDPLETTGGPLETTEAASRAQILAGPGGLVLYERLQGPHS